jgi:hypothetical protein
MIKDDRQDLRLRYPSALLAARRRAADHGSFRERVRFDLVDRAQHGFGLLAAADLAKFVGVQSITAIEFGVADGAGLRNLAEVAAAVTTETSVTIHIVGFDSGVGLSTPADYRDHPEIWSGGDFTGPGPAALRDHVPAEVELVLGPVSDTVPGFVESPHTGPVGFVSFDLDLYSSTRDALALFTTAAESLLPVVISYFDDVSGGVTRIGSLFRTEAAGQLLAIQEFNNQQRLRRIDPIRVLRHRRPLDREPWLDRMYGLHVLDHPFRNQSRTRAAMSMAEHAAASELAWPL